MAFLSEVSSVFVESAKALMHAPDDYHHKADTLTLHVKMKSLAGEGDAVAQYRLAKAYSKNSSMYAKWMQASASQGFTNALLALSQLYIEQNSVKKAALCLIQIINSNDSFIKSEARALFAKNPLLKAEISRQMVSSAPIRLPYRFFSSEPKNRASALSMQPVMTQKICLSNPPYETMATP
ncbi:MAG: hypothetical protein WC785_06950 [Tatlockia sp.]|jgi:TPR repeat protein